MIIYPEGDGKFLNYLIAENELFAIHKHFFVQGRHTVKLYVDAREMMDRNHRDPNHHMPAILIHNLYRKCVIWSYHYTVNI